MRPVLHAVSRRQPLAVAGLVLAAAVFIGAFTTRMTGYDPDELTYTRMAMRMADTLSPLALDDLGRSRLNQLYPLTIAPLYALFDTVTAYRIAHAWNALLMASTVIPAFLLGRSLLARPWQAHLLAALVVLAPWITMASVLKTEVAAYPATLWALLAMHRALVRPSVRADALALAAVGLAAFARLQLIVLAPVFVAAILAHEIGFSLAEPDAPRGRLRRGLASAWHGHRVLALAAGAGLGVGLPLLASGVLSEVFGFYGNTLQGDLVPAGTFAMARENGVGIVLGVGVIPAALALGGWLEALVRPRARDVHALAVLSVLICAAVLVQVAATTLRFVGTFVQERYVMFLAPVVLAGAVVCLARSRRPAVATVMGGLAVAAALGVTSYQGEVTAYWYMVSPGLTTFLDLGAPVVDVAGAPDTPYPELAAIVLAASAAVALAVGRWSRPRSLAILGGAGLVLMALLSAHAFVRLLSGAGGGGGYGGGTIATANWVDRHVEEGAEVAIISRQLGSVADARERWWRVEFWNRSIVAAWDLGGPDVTWNGGGRIVLSPSSRRVLAGPSGFPYVVTSTSGVPYRLAGTRLARSPDERLELLRVPNRLRADWVVTDLSDDGWLPMDGDATLSVFGLRGEADCRRLELTLEAPDGVAAPRRVLVAGPGPAGRVLAAAPGRTRERLRVCGAAGGGARHVRIGLAPSRDVGATPVTARLLAIRALEA